MTYFKLLYRYMVPYFLNGFRFYDVLGHGFIFPNSSLSKVDVKSLFLIILIVSSSLSAAQIYSRTELVLKQRIRTIRDSILKALMLIWIREQKHRDPDSQTFRTVY